MSKNIELAKKIIHYSCEIETNQNVVIQMIGDSCKPLLVAIEKELKEIGAHLKVINQEPSHTAELIRNITVEKAKEMAQQDLVLIYQADVCIMLKSIENEDTMTGLSKQKKEIYAKYYRKTMDSAILETRRWISLRYPNKRMADNAGMSFEAYRDYFFKVCNVDYSLLSDGMTYLEKLMGKTSSVRITGPNTDLSFLIKDIPVHKCDGHINLPDGEVYTAPVRQSINGYIEFNVPTNYFGTEFNKVGLRFEHGKIVEARSENPENRKALMEILSIDHGASYIGEFALGVNPYITFPTKDILFDEKISGSFHLTPGFSYKDAFNGNESAIHWDLVCIQTKEYGGGEIHFDGRLIRKDGYFLDEKLKVLNP